MDDPLNKHNAFGKPILRIVSRGNALIAELLRIKNYIPDIFRLQTKTEQRTYGDLIFDFNYFKISAFVEERIETNKELKESDDEIRDYYLEILTRIFLAFESIHQYAVDLRQFVQDVNGGLYMQETFESMQQNNQYMQLMCEALYIYGMILVITERYIPGIVRERLLVSFYRYSAHKTRSNSNIDDVCELLRSTGYDAQNNKMSLNHIFSRFQFDKNFVEMVVRGLSSDDIYNQVSIYPLPHQRHACYSQQSAMLFICLYFTPSTLHHETSFMREVVEKFFPDHWAVSLYMGITVSLVDAWDNFKAAKVALNSTTNSNYVKNVCLTYRTTLERVLLRLKDILREGMLTEQFVIENIKKMMSFVRECNICLRWFFLNTSQPVISLAEIKSRKLRDLIIQESEFSNVKVLELLLNLSELELRIRDVLKMLMVEKIVRWTTHRKKAVDRVLQLIELFSGTQRMTKLKPRESLKRWFGLISSEISSLFIESPSITIPKIIQIIQALNEVKEFHYLEANMHVKENLLEIKVHLHKMVQIMNIEEETLIHIQLIGDFSYAWLLFDKDYTQIIQKSIRKNPVSLTKLRATFLKLASALEIPLLRINEDQSEDLVSVSQYYSCELAKYYRNVLQIIPQLIFEMLTDVIDSQSKMPTELPVRLEKQNTKMYAEFDWRYRIARLTYSISIFIEGILTMEKTLVGVVEVDPKQILEDGIRKEITKNITQALRDGLVVSNKGQLRKLLDKLIRLSKIIEGYGRSFEYAQDYLKIQGFEICHEELARIINNTAEFECQLYTRNSVDPFHHREVGQDLAIFQKSFLGYLALQILECTDPKTSFYLELRKAWYERRTQKVVTDIYIFEKIRRVMGPAGLVGLSKMFGVKLSNDVCCLVRKLQHSMANDRMWIDALDSMSKSLSNYLDVQNPSKYYFNVANKWVKVWPNILNTVLSIGQKQILIEYLNSEIGASCRIDSTFLESSTKILNSTLLNEVRKNQGDETNPMPSNDLLYDFDKCLETTGFQDAGKKIFVTAESLDYVPLFMFLFSISHMNSILYTKSTKPLVERKHNEQIDGYVFIVGILCILRQFHSDYIRMYLKYLYQYIESWFQFCLGTKHGFYPELKTALKFAELFSNISNTLPSKVDREFVESIFQPE